jgi:hypothetical protein
MQSDNAFTSRQIMQILIPGIYFVTFLSILLEKNLSENFNGLGDKNIVIYTLFSILFGLLFYLIDLPKFILDPIFPTSVLKKKHKLENHNQYFDFYDNILKSKFQDLTERYTSIFYLGVNLAFASTLLIIVFFILKYIDCSYHNSIIFLISFVLILSLIISFLVVFGKNKIKYVFDRQVNSFLKWLEDK